MNSNLDIVIYKSGNITIDVRLKKETIWLSLNQIAQLFEKDKSVISRHIQNVYKSGELQREGTVAKIATVQNEGGRSVKRQIDYYNLDVIISVGYRVNSQKATQFRIWATNVLKSYLLNGYAVNQNLITQAQLRKLEQTIKFIKNNINTPTLTASEVKGMLEIIQKYAMVWKWIELYDSGEISPVITRKESKPITYEVATDAIEQLRTYLQSKGETTELFGIERDKGLFVSALKNVYQTFAGEELYPTFELKAANLLYLIIKNHPFVDGNKRIGALLFLMFLYENLTIDDLLNRFNNNTLTALCYLVAASPAEQKEMLINLITNFISTEFD